MVGGHHSMKNSFKRLQCKEGWESLDKWNWQRLCWVNEHMHDSIFRRSENCRNWEQKMHWGYRGTVMETVHGPRVNYQQWKCPRNLVHRLVLMVDISDCTPVTLWEKRACYYVWTTGTQKFTILGSRKNLGSWVWGKDLKFSVVICKGSHCI